MMSPVHRGGGPDAIPASTVTRWLWSWVAPSLLGGVLAVVFWVGVYVGRGPYEALEFRMTAHETEDHGPSSETLEVLFDGILRRLEGIETKLDE